jgi:hypothetical protein
MLNMSGHGASHRNSTPEANTHTSLRPLSSRAFGSGQAGLRASADMAALTGPPANSRIRPSSDVYTQPGIGQAGSEVDPQDKLAQQWIAEIDQYETTLEEMAAAALDQDFKDELSAIEQWFRVLSEAERTAALYALLQQTTQVQIRFFIQVLQQMGKNHPMSGVLSPANFESDPMSTRLSDAMSKLNIETARNSLARPTGTGPSTKRHSGLDSSTINAMFPDAAAAIATEKAKFTQQTGNMPSSNRNSNVGTAPTIVAPPDAVDAVTSSWTGSKTGGTGNNQETSMPTAGTSGASAQLQNLSNQPPMGQFVQPQPAGSIRSGQPQITSNTNIQSTTLTTMEKPASELPLLSPYGASGTWASMVNTPLVHSFASNTPNTQADMVANATAMKLAALSTVNNRFALDDVRKYRRARSNDAPGGGITNNQLGPQAGHGMLSVPSANVVMINEHGQLFSRDQMVAIQQQSLNFGGQRSRPSSPGLTMQQQPLQSGAIGGEPFTSSRHHGFLSAYDGAPGLLPTGMGQFGVPSGQEGYLSDHSEIRGRSPRGRRGSSKPPEDPTDPSLLQDIPTWLRSLRLHKYTDQLKDLAWDELIELDDAQLVDRGVNALGARRKMLKVFEQVKEAKAEGKLNFDENA